MSRKPIMKYIFNLGHQPKISLEEIKSVLERLKISNEIYFQSEKFLILELDQEINSQKILTDLGGTVKIGKEIEKTENIENSAIPSFTLFDLQSSNYSIM